MLGAPSAPRWIGYSSGSRAVGVCRRCAVLFEAEPAMRYESSFTVPSPAVDVTEDDHAYKVTAELPGMSEKDIEVLVSGNSLMLKGEKHQEREQKGKNFCPSAHTVRFVAASTSLTVWIATRSRRTSSRGCLPLRCPSRLRWWKSRRRSRSSRPPDLHWPRHPRPFLMPWASHVYLALSPSIRRCDTLSWHW